MDKLVTKILSRLSGAYPSFMQLEECRADICEEPAAFKRGIAYLHEKLLIELKDGVASECDGIYGEVRVTASGLDFLTNRSRTIKATFLR